MKNSIKRILSVLFCFCIILTPTPAFAENPLDQPINGNIKTAVEFTGWSMQNVISLYENGGLDTQELINKNLLYIDEQGEPALSVVLPDLMVHVDGQPMSVDTNQSFFLADLAVGEHNVQVMNASAELLNESFILEENENEIQNESTANIYCNATAKSGGYYAGFKNKGYNCSSFTFLKGDERLSNY